MILPWTKASSLVLGVLATSALGATASSAEDYIVAGTITQAATRCADFGPGFVDMGNGVCGRVGTQGRVQMGTRSASSNSWTTNGTSSATMRTDGMLPGAATQHLRVRNGLDNYSPFR